jgi:hypothetical protein
LRIGQPQLHALDPHGPDGAARPLGNLAVRRLAQQPLLLVGPPGTVVAGL